MSTPTYFFVGTTFDAVTASFTGDLQVKPVFRGKNITPDMIADLDFVLTGCRDREPDCVRDDEIAVYRLEEAFVYALAGMEDVRLAEIADEWGIFDTSGTITLLGQLRDLAMCAVKNGAEVFYCF